MRKRLDFLIKYYNIVISLLENIASYVIVFWFQGFSTIY